MKIIVEFDNKSYLKDNNLLNSIDGIILSLKNFSCESSCYYSIDEIKNISKKYNKEIFININKNIFNEDIEELKNVLNEIEKIKVKGIIFYDTSIPYLKKQLNLKTDLVLSQTFMTLNSNICNLYYDLGVKYSYLSKELTIDEVCNICNNSKSKILFEVLSCPYIATSRRSLVTNYYKDLDDKNIKHDISNIISVKNDNKELIFEEYKDNTSIMLNKIVNRINDVSKLKNSGCEYIVLKNHNIDDDYFKETLKKIGDICG